MKLAMSERAKHQLIGALVIISLLIIFLPAALKKSNRNFESNIKIALKLPSKPSMPSVDLPTDKQMFNSAKVVDAKEIKVAKVRKNLLIAKAEPLEVKRISSSTSNIASVSGKQFKTDDKLIKVADNADGQIFSIQVASFTQKSNADVLVGKLKNKGFNASYNKDTNKNGKIFYHVVVGKLRQRGKAVDLQKELASSMQLNGFIVQSEVS